MRNPISATRYIVRKFKPFALCIIYGCFALILLQACSKSHSPQSHTQNSESTIQNPIFGIKGDRNDTDPLKIGSYPSLPAKPHSSNPSPILQGTSESSPDSETLTPHKPYSAPRTAAKPHDKQYLPKPIVGTIYIDEDKSKAFDLSKPTLHTQEALVSPRSKPTLGVNAQSSLNAPIPTPNGDWIVLISPGGSALTIWALAQGNWIWGYSLIDSIGFGGARVWRFRFFENDQVMIENAKTQTCLNGYKNGIIHMACNEKNRYQRFVLTPMSNGAVQIKNVGFNACIEIPIGDIFGDFHKVNGVFLNRCATGSNLNQQFYVAPPTFLENPLYKR